METPSIRDRSAVGRFPTVTPGFGDDKEVEKEESEEINGEKENACCRWLRQVCPFCCRTPNDDDITDTLVTGIDDLDKDDGPNGEKPVTGGSELNGMTGILDSSQLYCLLSKLNASHSINFTVLYLYFCRTPPECEIDRLDEKQIRPEPLGSSHKSLPK